MIQVFTSSMERRTTDRVRARNRGRNHARARLNESGVAETAAKAYSMVKRPLAGAMAVPRSAARRSARRAQAARKIRRWQCLAKAPMVKVCGVTNARDAELAAQRGVDFVGAVLSPPAKRGVSEHTAKDIASAASENGAAPVAVFVDETPEIIDRVVSECGFKFAQLHGYYAREALFTLNERIKAIYALSVDENGDITTPKPAEIALERDHAKGGPCAGENGWKKASDWVSRGRRTVDYMLLDSAIPGSGKQSCEWNQMTPPKGASRCGFILAGGLNPSNVADAVEMLNPNGVDVSSGVCGLDGLRKDPELIEQFVQNAKHLQSFHGGGRDHVVAKGSESR